MTAIPCCKTNNFSEIIALLKLVYEMLVYPLRIYSQAIESAGFSDVDMKKVRAPVDHAIFQIVNPSLIGCATK